MLSHQRSDPFDLERFLKAQDTSYQSALDELRAGRKETHWSWFIFPQVLGLGSSPTSVHYAIRSLGEAEAYLVHPILGSRLRECVSVINSHSDLSARQILGEIDAMKLRSCLTLFAQLECSEPLFEQALGKYFAGKPDPATLAILTNSKGADAAP